MGSLAFRKRDLGPFNRLAGFRVDSDLPTGFVRVSDNDYSNISFDRGHLRNSKDRSNTAERNAVTFLMTNILPQTADNNQGPWRIFETFELDLANAGHELYIYAGAFGGTKRTANDKVVIPKTFWKSMVVISKAMAT